MSSPIQKAPASDSTIAARYMTRFQCIGGDCEDTCCGGWNVTVDQEHYKKIGALLSATSDGKRRFEELVRLQPPNLRSKRSFAVISQPTPGRCPFLGEDRLCELHRAHGEDALPDACANFPRATSQVEERLELFADLGCPETARLCLLADDAMELVPIARDRIGRVVVRQRVAGRLPDPFVRRIDDVRGALYELLLDENYGLRSRLFFCAFLAHRIGPTFQRDSKRFDERALDRELAAVAHPPNRARLDELLRGAEIANSIAPAVVFTVLEGMAVPSGFPAVARFVADALAAAITPGATRAPDGRAGTAQRLDAYIERASALPSDLTTRFALALRNYALNFVMKDWYLQSPTLILHLHRFLLRVAMLRYLVALHPALPDACAATGEEERRRRFDRIVVEVVYRLSRVFDASDRYLDLVKRALEETKMLELQHAVALIAF